MATDKYGNSTTFSLPFFLAGLFPIVSISYSRGQNPFQHKFTKNNLIETYAEPCDKKYENTSSQQKNNIGKHPRSNPLASVI
ncbi:MAG: hypothetical protein NC452_20820 [Eubacterium sp.]|nr:hypothetical protein [Eubacterium sp.]